MAAWLMAACTREVTLIDAGEGGAAAELRAHASEACWAFCEAFIPCTGDEPWPLSDCVGYCDAFEGCEAPADEYFACAADHFGDECGAGADDPCIEELRAARGCTLRSTACEEGTGSCHCDGEVLDLTLAVSCESSDSGGAGQHLVACECRLNGELVTTCEQEALECSAETSCCTVDFR